MDTAFPQLPLLFGPVWLARALSGFIFSALLQEMGKRFEVRIGMKALYKQELWIFQNGSDFCKALLSWNWKVAATPNLHLTLFCRKCLSFAPVLKPHSGRVFERPGRVGRGQCRQTFRRDCVLSMLHT